MICNQPRKVEMGGKREQNNHVPAARQVSEGTLSALSAACGEGQKKAMAFPPILCHSMPLYFLQAAALLCMY